jgi:hypothetical protein
MTNINKYSLANKIIAGIAFLLFFMKIYTIEIYILLLALVLFIIILSKKYGSKDNDLSKNIVPKTLAMLAIGGLYWWFSGR